MSSGDLALDQFVLEEGVHIAGTLVVEAGGVALQALVSVGVGAVV